MEEGGEEERGSGSEQQAGPNCGTGPAGAVRITQVAT